MTRAVKIAVTSACLSFLLVGCRRNPEESAVSDPAPPPAAALAPFDRSSLDRALQMIEAELAKAKQEGADESAEEHILRAEAITDRLLETQVPFEWIARQNYSLEARLRQIQSLADRVVAQLRSGVRGDLLLPEIDELSNRVKGLRAALALGGGRAPTPLDSLLARHPTDTIKSAEP